MKARKMWLLQTILEAAFCTDSKIREEDRKKDH
jgi:hypothetical protein